MSEWKEYKLGEVLSIKYGKDHKQLRDGVYPVYGSGGVMRFVDKFIYDDESILIPRKGSLNNIFYESKAFWTVDTMFWSVINKTKAYPKFLYYQLTLVDFENLNVGSAVPSLTIPTINEVDISLPSLDTQRRIASILTSLDDKIDLLRRENATLEAMAETLFRQWFVEEAKEEWKEGKLGDYVELINGVSYKGDELQPSKVAMVTLKSFDRNGGFRIDGYKEFTGKYKKEQVLHDGDLVVAHTDITQEADVIGNPAIVICKHQYETITFSMDVVKVVSKSEFFSNSFLYYLMKTQTFKEHCLGYANGSTVLHLSKKAIPEFEFRVPPIEMARNFQEQVESFDKKIINNNSEIQTLIQTRDGLLPKLMSNEIILLS